MQLTSKWIILLFFSFIWCNIHAQSPGFKKYQLDSLVEKAAKINKPWYEFINEVNLYGGIYRLPKEGVDKQPVHDEDEIYIIMNGDGKLVAGDSVFRANQGSVFFVKAHIPHRFIEITQPLTVLVLFSKANPSLKDIPAISYSMSSLKSLNPKNKEKWTLFHQSSNILLSLYNSPFNIEKDNIACLLSEAVYIVTQGDGYLHYKGGKLKLTKGDVLYLPGKSECYFSSQNSKIEVIAFSGIRH